VLLLTGVGMAAVAKTRIAPVLGEEFRVLVVQAGSAAGAGGEGQILPLLAEEAIEALDAAGEPRAHVYGLSFGGMVAQLVALRHPDRVCSLVLAATSAGGGLWAAPDELTEAFLRRRDQMPAEEKLWAGVPYSYALATRRRHASRIGEDLAQRQREPIDGSSQRVQRTAARLHDASDLLHEVSAPTLVLHGAEDRLVPPANGHLLAERIKGRFVQVANAGHVLPTDAPQVDRDVVRFLLSGRATGPQSAGSGSARAARA
jgi:3-oxoadipate enol-lactonase